MAQIFHALPWSIIKISLNISCNWFYLQEYLRIPICEEIHSQHVARNIRSPWHAYIEANRMHNRYVLSADIHRGWYHIAISLQIDLHLGDWCISERKPGEDLSRRDHEGTRLTEWDSLYEIFHAVVISLIINYQLWAKWANGCSLPLRAFDFLCWSQCALLEMSQMWNRMVSSLTKISKLDLLKVPVIKVDQSKGWYWEI